MPGAPDLAVLLVKWLPILRLQDPDLFVSYARGYDMGGKLGSCHVNLERNSATIKILNPDDLSAESSDHPHDCELTLVHELLHWHFDPIMPDDSDSLEYAHWERVIDMLSVILVKLTRSLEMLEK